MKIELVGKAAPPNAKELGIIANLEAELRRVRKWSEVWKKAAKARVAWKDSFYCPTCGACGESGCCEPWRCQKIICLYGEYYQQDYEELIQDFDMVLTELHDTIAKTTELEETIQSLEIENNRLYHEKAELEGW